MKPFHVRREMGIALGKAASVHSKQPHADSFLLLFHHKGNVLVKMALVEINHPCSAQCLSYLLQQIHHQYLHRLLWPAQQSKSYRYHFQLSKLEPIFMRRRKQRVSDILSNFPFKSLQIIERFTYICSFMRIDKKAAKFFPFFHRILCRCIPTIQ